MIETDIDPVARREEIVQPHHLYLKSHIGKDVDVETPLREDIIGMKEVTMIVIDTIDMALQGGTKAHREINLRKWRS